ncbi:hypothetical protein QTP88_014370 [Uroleucon formosanum]
MVQNKQKPIRSTNHQDVIWSKSDSEEKRNTSTIKCFSYNRQKSSPFKSPYGKFLYERDKFLNEMYDNNFLMRCKGRNSLHNFQKGILMHINGTKNLLEILKENGQDYLWTSKINNDSLCNLICQIFSEEYQTLPLNVLHRLRKIILGKYPGFSFNKLNNNNHEEFIVAQSLKLTHLSLGDEDNQREDSEESDTDTTNEDKYRNEMEVDVKVDKCFSYNRQKSSPFKSPYGKFLYERDKFLNEMYDNNFLMRCKGRNSLHNFQKGILMHINGTKNLLEILKENGQDYLWTSKINNDSLCNLICQIFSEEYQTLPLNVLHRLRKIILGKYPGFSFNKLNNNNHEEFIVAQSLKLTHVSLGDEDNQREDSEESDTDTTNEDKYRNEMEVDVKVE